MKYHVRNQYGELEVGSFAELWGLYHQQFVSDDDEVRREGTDRWIKAGAMAELRGAKPRRHLEGNELVWLWIAIALGSLLLVLALFLVDGLRNH